jgi:hypothetical protein
MEEPWTKKRAVGGLGLMVTPDGAASIPPEPVPEKVTLPFRVVGPVPEMFTPTPPGPPLGGLAVRQSEHAPPSGEPASGEPAGGEPASYCAGGTTRRATARLLNSSTR